MLFPSNIEHLAREIISRYGHEKAKIATAESCTGGMLATALTEIPGSSAIFDRGFISYNNEAKIDVLGVLPELLAKHGPVSPEVAEAMAKGALEYSRADVALAVTGIAGPSGGTPQTPIGLVYFGLATKAGAVFHVQGQFSGDRDAIRLQATQEGLELLLSLRKED